MTSQMQPANASVRRVRKLALVLSAAGCVAALPSLASALPMPLPEPRRVNVERAQAKPGFEFADGMKHDFGKIWDHSTVKHRFKFTNVGEERLSITDVQTSCGCTISGVQDADGNDLPANRRLFEPGETGYVVAEFDPKRRNGVQIKPIRIYVNGERTPEYTLEIRANVDQIIEQEPSIVYFRGVEKFGERPTMELELIGRVDDFDANLAEGQNTDDSPFTIERIGVEEREGVDGQPKTAVKFLVTVKEGADQGVVRNVYDFTTTDERAKLVQIPISAQVLGDLTTDPRRINIGRIEPGSEVETSFTVSSKTQRDFEVEEVLITGAFQRADVDITPLEEGKHDAYKVTIKQMASPMPRQNGTVTVKTSLKDESEIRLSYYGWVTREAATNAQRTRAPRDPNAVRERTTSRPQRANDSIRNADGERADPANEKTYSPE